MNNLSITTTAGLNMKLTSRGLVSRITNSIGLSALKKTTPMNTFEIYGLCDPLTNEIRYVGKANNRFERLKTHLLSAKKGSSPVHCWLRSLTQRGLKPIVILLEKTMDWQQSEVRMIEVLRGRGFKLLNVSKGGNEPTRPNPRVWYIKKQLKDLLRRGYVSDLTKAKLRLAAQKRPDMFGEWAAIT